jgi:ribosomal protein S18 acetylase RimI-like enzyme
VRYRPGSEVDARAVAALHAESWRHHYRGVYTDAYLDGEVHADRLATWTDRLAAPGPDRHLVVADDDGAVVGFAYTILGHDPTWGALLDNLHVAVPLKGRGVGTRLMAEAARTVVDRAPGEGLYLWVLEANAAARAFYDARGGRCVGREASEEPGGAVVVGLRYAWPDPSSLLLPG